LAAAVATVEMVESLAVVAESLAEVAAMAVVEAAVVMAVMTVVAGLLAMVTMVTGLVELLVELLATVVGAGEEILWEQAEERSPRRPQAGPEQGEPSLLQTTRQLLIHRLLLPLIPTSYSNNYISICAPKNPLTEFSNSHS
jgi:hypothetical protein